MREARAAPATGARSPQIVPVSRAERTAWHMNDVLVPANMVAMASEIDATALDAIRADHAARHGAPPSYTALVIKAAGRTMLESPEANRAILGPPLFRRLYQFDQADIGVAVEKSLPALPGAAFAVPIRSCAMRSLGDLTRELRDLARCTESTEPRYRLFRWILRYVPWPLSVWLIHAPHWIPSLWARHRGCAAWVNAPSKAGADLVTTTWPWPITFSFGIVKERPLVIGGQLAVRRTMPVVMVFDRRIMGGGPASRVFARFQEILARGLVDDDDG
jgi:pyruvate/2-oxoglutarate dehydrogenase complex dihydrolipoamide acyltransferase (E2) component